MDPVRIEDISLRSESEGLVLFDMDRPMQGEESDIFAFEVEGWVIGRVSPVAAVELLHQNRRLRLAKVDIPRADVNERYPNVRGSTICGFHTFLSVVGLPLDFEIIVRAKFEDSQTELATIRVCRKPLRTDYPSTFQPLILSSLGRMGTTFLLRLLAEHPQIAAHKKYPYETRVTSYWMHLLKVLSEPYNPVQSIPRDDFLGNLWGVGTNPFYDAGLFQDGSVLQWLGLEQIRRLATFCQESVDQFYLQVLQSEAHCSTRYFIEKYLPSHVQWLLWDLYPGVREIFLVRDFRDMFSSILAFNEKLGVQGFGRREAVDDRDFIRRTAFAVRRLYQNWVDRSEKSILVRYEDLVHEPMQILEKLLDYLELDAGENLMQEMIRTASQVSPELLRHRTSPNPEESIGRWRKDLPDHLKAGCQDELGDILEELGYD